MNHRFTIGLRAIALLSAAFVVSATAVLTVGVAPAVAHDQLLDSAPQSGAALEIAPAEVALTFSDKVLTIGAVILLMDQNDRNWIGDDPTFAGTRVTAPISGALPDGGYQIRWRVISSDGHPISGIVPFSVGALDRAAPAIPSTQPGTTAAANANGDSAATPSDGTTPAQALTDNGPLRAIIVGAGGAAVAILLFVGYTNWRHRRTRGATTNRSR